MGLEVEDRSGSVGEVIPSGSRDVGCPWDYEEDGGKCIALAKTLYYYIRKKTDTFLMRIHRELYRR